MLAELSSTMAMLVGRTENTGSLSARISSASSNSCRKKIGGKWSRPQGRLLICSLPVMKSSRLEKITRRGLRRSK